jgi:hypothetical protein
MAVDRALGMDQQTLRWRCAGIARVRLATRQRSARRDLTVNYAHVFLRAM